MPHLDLVWNTAMPIPQHISRYVTLRDGSKVRVFVSNPEYEDKQPSTSKILHSEYSSRHNYRRYNGYATY
jgi:hypothetical protein